MKDPRTTAIGLITGVGGLLSYFDVLLPEAWMPVITFLGITVLGFFSKDKPKKGA